MKCQNCETVMLPVMEFELMTNEMTIHLCDPCADSKEFKNTLVEFEEVEVEVEENE